MKKRKKDDDNSCLMWFVKATLILACVYWGIITMERTIDVSLWFTGGIAVVSYLLVKLFKDDSYVAMHTITCTVALCFIILTVNFYFPISTIQRKAVVKEVYESAGSRMRTTKCVLHFIDNSQEVNVGGGINKEECQVGDTVTVTYQRGCLGMDVVRDICFICEQQKRRSKVGKI